MLAEIRYRGVAVSHMVRGKGRAVVLLHGFLGSKEIWENTIANLSRSYKVIAIDLPGHGQTPCIGYAHSMDMIARCVKAVLDHLRLKKYVMVGHSMGGYVALAFAELFPDHLRGLCLFHSTAYPDSEQKKEDRLRAIALVKQNRRIYTNSTIRNLFASKNLKYLKDELGFASRIAAGTSKQGIIASLHGMRDRPARDLVLSLLDYPVMMVIGEHDNILQPSLLLEQAKHLRHGIVLLLEHDGHFGFLESPAQTNQALRKFLRRCFLQP